MYTLRHNDPHFTGEIFGVQFVDGTAVTNDANAVAYFRRRANRGFGVVGTTPGDAAAADVQEPTVTDMLRAAEALGLKVPAKASKATIAEMINDVGLDEPA